MKKLLLALAAAMPLLGAPASVRLEGDVPVRLRFKQAISSETARVNQRVEFEVVDDVTAGGAVVISKGSTAWGKVADASPAGRLMRNGRLAIDIEAVSAANGATVKLRAGAKGEGRKPHDAATDSLGALPALPVTMFQYGKIVEIPAGKLVTVYTASALVLGAQGEAAPPPARHFDPVPTTSSVLPPAKAAGGYDAPIVEPGASSIAAPAPVAEPAPRILPSTQPSTTARPESASNSAAPAPESVTRAQLRPEPAPTATTSRTKKLITIIALGAAVGVASVLAAKGHGGSVPAATATGTTAGSPPTTVGIGGITVGGPH